MENLIAMKKAAQEAEHEFKMAVRTAAKNRLPYTWGLIEEGMTTIPMMSPEWFNFSKKFGVVIDHFEAQVGSHVADPRCEWVETSWGLGDGETIESAIARAIVHRA